MSTKLIPLSQFQSLRRKRQQRIKIDAEEMEYPVGGNIDYNLPIIENMAEELIKHIDGRVNLWCIGSSGAIVAGFIVSILRNNDKNIHFTISHVKKIGENSHTGSTTWEKDAINVVVDDFIYTGESIKNILEYMDINNLTPDILCVSGDIHYRTLTKGHKFYKFGTIIANNFIV